MVTWHLELLTWQAFPWMGQMVGRLRTPLALPPWRSSSLHHQQPQKASTSPRGECLCFDLPETSFCVGPPSSLPFSPPPLLPLSPHLLLPHQLLPPQQLPQQESSPHSPPLLLLLPPPLQRIRQKGRAALLTWTARRTAAGNRCCYCCCCCCYCFCRASSSPTHYRCHCHCCR